jgi:GT2 family glycosyltransferase/glycosyltransferase involved in cell wall biosynthesis
MSAAAPVAVDVVVPVYNAPADLARCVESVLAHTRHPYRLVLIDDGSTDPAIGAYFAALARRSLPQVTLLANGANQGFTATANRGMRLSSADVVLLNSDTAVTAGWLDALARCAASDPSIGTITPFSNNAEICSFPRFCEDNGWTDGADPEPVRAALARAAVPTYPDLPTGVGFCLYVRRALIDAIGVFDPAFGLGYGEENDFCMRAAAAGWRNVLCDDAFVLHLGARSFEGRKAELGARNMALLLARHPTYRDLVGDYIARDPVAPIRAAALAQLRIRTGPARGALHVIHGHGGGTEHHVRALIDMSRRRYRHYLAMAIGDRWQCEEHLDDGSVRTFDFRRRDGEPWRDFVGGICATFAVDVVHLHNLSMCRDGLLEALPGLGVPYGYTVHDLNFACPTITFLGTDGMYCGAVTDPAACARCLAAQPDFAGVDIARWRARHGDLLARAAFLIAPSRWAASMLARYFPGRVADVVAHGAPGAWASQDPPSGGAAATPVGGPRMAVVLPADDVPTVAVLGAVGPDKGARRLERLVALARERGACVRFVLIGYTDVLEEPWQSDDAMLTVHGAYAAIDLPDLLAHYRARLVAFPSAGPETFSFTLSEAWASGLPVVVPPFGALAERLGETGAGWAWTDDEWRSEDGMLDRILQIVAPAHAAALAAAAGRARELSLPTLATMAERTLGHYDAAPAARAAAGPFAAVRVRDALGYVPWVPPMPPPVARAAPGGVGRVAARVALRWRHTPAGRVLYALTPAGLIDALKARLR